MSIDSDVVKRGYLKVVASKGLIGSLTRLSTKKHWIVLRSESRTGLCRIEIYKDEDDVSRKNPTKIISVEQVSSLQTNLERKDITLSMFGETVTFGCSSRADLDDWVRDIEYLRQNKGATSGSKKTQHTLAPPDEDQFRVRLRQSTSLLFHGSCILEIQRDFERNLFHIAVFTEENPPRLIVKWQIDHIRQYGSNEVAFKFQSGSKSPTNVDWFIVDTDPGDAPKIHRAVDFWARHIVDQARNIPLRRNSSISANTPPRGDRLSQSIPPTSPPFVTRTPSVPLPNTTPTYMHLLPNNRQQTPIYDGIGTDNRQLPSPPSPISSSIPTSANSVYQSLLATPPAEKNPSTSVYAGLDATTRDRQGSTNIRTDSTVTDIAPQRAEYMELTNATRTSQDPTYMGINPTKT